MKTQSGFTLIEVLLYLALMTIFLGGILGCFYALAMGAEDDGRRAELSDEANFLAAKILWAFAGAKKFSIQGDGTILAVYRYDVSDSVVTFQLNDNSLQIQEAGHPAERLNTGEVALKNSTFQESPPVVNQPEGLSLNFNLELRSATGQLLAKKNNFNLYLQK